MGPKLLVRMTVDCRSCRGCCEPIWSD